MKLGGAFEKGGKEAYSIVTKFNTDAMVSAADLAKQQIGKLNEIARLFTVNSRGIASAAIIKRI